ncbi:cupin domain-containing protein [Variovorax sp. J22P168]|uniref:cupin domain-containing protein n=1 Tax=Variovorax jilinensis TaxID=3053513 RepID=UPI00257629D5|nr:cupin domain-containing protein [Variovorax sp. J22P168]MDM0015174.1 cupin domain-containing protein [Variovorax sp. J22P168]
MAQTAPMEDQAARLALREDLARFDCRIAQPDDPPLFTRSPNSASQTTLWRWKDLEPLLERLGEQLTLDAGGQRRTLRLQNPGLPFGTTTTFWGSIQVILPGEIAGAHRHTANAFRFILKGSGATTTVNGERYTMNEGDLVLTPGMTWHDHEYHGETPMIWLDVLDISLMRSMHATFFEPGEKIQQEVSAVPDASWRKWGSGLMSPPGQAPRTADNPLLVYPHEVAQAALQAAAGLPPDPFDDVVLEYRNPLTGGPAMRTMGMRLQTLRPGMRGRARRHTGSKLYYVVRGEGATIVEGRTYEWSTGDFLTIQPWAWHEHLNRSSTGEATLFQVNDFPAMSVLGYYFEEERAEAAS